MSGRRLRILTWHVHGNYLYYLSQVPHDFLVLCDAGRSPGYAGRAGSLPWGDNVIELPLEDVAKTRFDCVLYQSWPAYERDRLTLLSPAQRRLPSLYIEHDPPRGHACDSRHPVDDPNTLLIHVSHFNQLMWDNGRTPSRVIEHGVCLPAGVRYDGRLARGIAVVNHLTRRGRRLGADIFAEARRAVPLDLVGMAAETAGGLGEVPNLRLPAFMARYRFYFHPVRWTSLGLALIEAMMVGLPVVALATTELVTLVRDGESGFIATNPDRLLAPMRRLLADPAEAAALGANGRRLASERFHIARFIADWQAVLRQATAV